MTVDELKQKLQHFTSARIDLVIKDNRSTFLHIIKKKKNHIKLFLHRLFLSCSDDICRAIGEYILNYEKKALIPIRKYAQKYFLENNYEHQLKKSALKTEGYYYNLKDIYNQLNERYFNNEHKAEITWFAQPKYSRWSHLTFGSYSDSLKLIRINAILDDPFVPPYFLSFVVYHEMLHHLLPSFLDKKGRRQMHTKEFLEKEKQFYYYSHATNWEKEMLSIFIRKKKKASNGRP